MPMKIYKFVNLITLWNIKFQFQGQTLHIKWLYMSTRRKPFLDYFKDLLTVAYPSNLSFP